MIEKTQHSRTRAKLRNLALAWRGTLTFRSGAARTSGISRPARAKFARAPRGLRRARRCASAIAPGRATAASYPALARNAGVSYKPWTNDERATRTRSRIGRATPKRIRPSLFVLARFCIPSVTTARIPWRTLVFCDVSRVNERAAPGVARAWREIPLGPHKTCWGPFQDLYRRIPQQQQFQSKVQQSVS